ncbi:MAG TPA: MFS transporter [Acidimicrobiales bacterium]|jgi:MFS family permease
MAIEEQDAGLGLEDARAPFLRRTFSSLSSRNFRLFFTGQIISNTGNWLTLVALTLLVLERTGSGVAVGLLSACQFGPILLFSAWGGVLVDRFSKRKLLATTQTLEMAQSFVLSALAFAHNAPLAAFYVTAFVGGCLLAVDNPVRRSMVNELVPARDVPNAVTLYSAMVNVSRIGGPVIAGALIVSVGYGWCFAIDGVSYITVLVALALMHESELRRLPITPRGPGQIRAGVRYIATVPDLWITFAMLLAIGTISYNFSVVFPLFVVKGLHENEAAYTYVYAAFSAGGLLGAMLVARRSTVGIRTVVIGAASLGVAMLVLSAVPNEAFAIVLAVPVGAASVAYMTSTTSIAQLRTDPHMIGRVLSLQTVLLVGTTPIGGPILGVISDSVGARAPMVIGAFGALAAAVFGIVAARRTHQH